MPGPRWRTAAALGPGGWRHRSGCSWSAPCRRGAAASAPPGSGPRCRSHSSAGTAPRSMTPGPRWSEEDTFDATKNTKVSFCRSYYGQAYNTLYRLFSPRLHRNRKKNKETSLLPVILWSVSILFDAKPVRWIRINLQPELIITVTDNILQWWCIAVGADARTHTTWIMMAGRPSTWQHLGLSPRPAFNHISQQQLGPSSLSGFYTPARLECVELSNPFAASFPCIDRHCCVLLLKACIFPCLTDTVSSSKQFWSIHSVRVGHPSQTLLFCFFFFLLQSWQRAELNFSVVSRFISAWKQIWNPPAHILLPP